MTISAQKTYGDASEASLRAAPEGREIEVSVVVSTCNRCKELPRLFEALANQTVNGKLAWELVLVDNRSTDRTAEITRAYAARSSYPIRYLYEGKQGKSYGLNMGISAARGGILAFTDDDGIPTSDWLERLVEHFRANPGVTCLGGRVELFNPADALITVKLSREPHSVQASTFTPSDIPIIGCNMAFRAEAFRTLGLYDTDLGPGSKAGVAEDVDMLYRLVIAGHSVSYDPRILVFHNHGRRTPEQVRSVRKGYVLGRGAFYCKYLMRGDGRALKWAYREVRSSILDWLRGGGVSERARDSGRHLGLLAGGAWRYLRFRTPPTDQPDLLPTVQIPGRST